MGIQQMLLGSKKPAAQGYTINAGTSGGTIGWSAAAVATPIGSCVPAAPAHNGYTVGLTYTSAGQMFFGVLGSHAGAAVFVSFVINGVTFTRAGSAVPGGTYNGTTATYWSWSGAAALVSGNNYPVTVQ